jgi:hypothetical protein
MDSLDKHLVWVLLQYLDARSLCRLSQTCRRLRDLCSATSVWESVFAREVVSPMAFVEFESEQTHPKDKVRTAHRLKSLKKFAKFRRLNRGMGTLYVKDKLYDDDAYIKGPCRVVGIDDNGHKALILGQVVVSGDCQLKNIDFEYVAPQKEEDRNTYALVSYFGDKLVVEQCRFFGINDGGRALFCYDKGREQMDDIIGYDSEENEGEGEGEEGEGEAGEAGEGEEEEGEGDVGSHESGESEDEGEDEDENEDDEEGDGNEEGQPEEDQTASGSGEASETSPRKQVGEARKVRFDFIDCEFCKGEWGIFAETDGMEVRIDGLKMHDVVNSLNLNGNGNLVFVSRFEISSLQGLELYNAAQVILSDGSVRILPGSDVTDSVRLHEVGLANINNVHCVGGLNGIVFVGSKAKLTDCRITGQAASSLFLRNMQPESDDGSMAEFDGLTIEGGTGDAIVIEELCVLQGSRLKIMGSGMSGLQVHGTVARLFDSTISGCIGNGIVLSTVGSLGLLDHVIISGCKESAFVLKQAVDFSTIQLQDVLIKSCLKPFVIEYVENEPPEKVTEFRQKLAACGDSVVLSKVEKMLGRKDFATIEAYTSWVLEQSRIRQVCTKKICGKVFLAIPQYNCISCNLTDDRGLGVCGYCKDAHHAKQGHNVSYGAVYEGNALEFYCDCTCEL